MDNPVLTAMMNRKSVRKYKPDMPGDEIIETVVRAGQQAPFASQLYSVILSRKEKGQYGAPLTFTILADLYKLERFMAIRGWSVVTNDLSLLLFAVQDASYMAQSMVIAAESMGLGSCFLGAAPYRAEQMKERYKLPDRVFPVVQLVMGYPDEERPLRPRYPLWFSLFEEEYPAFTDEQVSEAMKVMDDGYRAQDYYKRMKGRIHLDNREDIYDEDSYSWTEHISRKWGQWYRSPSDLIRNLKICGFDILANLED
jgi:nitroreductase